MTAMDILRAVEAVGGRVELAAGGMLTVGAPSGSLTPDLVSLLRERKADIVTMLKAGASLPGRDPMATEPRAWMEPNPARRGLLEVRGGQFLHFCPTCGRWASVGVGFNPPHSLGRW